MEFGAKLGLSLLEGHMAADTPGWDAYNESGDPKGQAKAYRALFGHWPELIQADDLRHQRQQEMVPGEGHTPDGDPKGKAGGKDRAAEGKGKGGVLQQELHRGAYRQRETGAVPQPDQGKAKGHLRVLDRGDPLRAEPLGPGTELGLYFLSKPYLEKIKWYLWHGNTYKALTYLEWFDDEVHLTENGYEHLDGFKKHVADFAAYIGNNEPLIINYGERCRNGEIYTSSFAESTINEVVARRFCKKQQMQWTKKGGTFDVVRPNQSAERRIGRLL